MFSFSIMSVLHGSQYPCSQESIRLASHSQSNGSRESKSESAPQARNSRSLPQRLTRTGPSQKRDKSRCSSQDTAKGSVHRHRRSKTHPSTRGARSEAHRNNQHGWIRPGAGAQTGDQRPSARRKVEARSPICSTLRTTICGKLSDCNWA